MIGITSYGAYIPQHRLVPETKGWGLPIEKAVAYYDEDSLTMSVTAAIDCLGDIDRHIIDAVYFASSTSPYSEKMAATTVAIVTDLRNDILTADYTNSLRSGTIALRMAIDTIKAGSANQVLVTAADCRMGVPRGDLERNLGDGAAAFLIGDTNVALTIEDSLSISDELYDVWRIDKDKFVRSWEERFNFDQGYDRVLPEAVGRLLKKSGLKPKDVNKAVFYGPDRRRHAEIGRNLGFQPEQIQDPLFGKMGNTGAAFCPMLLVAALENASPGDKILLASYGNGADVFLFKVTDQIAKIKDKWGMKRSLATKIPVDNYETYLSFRNFITGLSEPSPEASASAILRERDAIFRLHGGKCKACGTIQYPPQRVCTNCRTKDRFDPIRLSDKKGKLFTYSLDFISMVPAYDQPLVDSIIDFEIGGKLNGRANFAMTDRDQKEVKIGMEVEMNFRKLHSGGGINNYFWKCTPLRERKLVKEAK